MSDNNTTSTVILNKEIFRKGSLGNGGTSNEEAIAGAICGFIFGVSQTIIGQPFDALKTKMQAQSQYNTGGVLKTFKNIVKNEGFIHGFYRGIIPPLLGAAFIRSAQFSSYNFAWSEFGNSFKWTKEQIPFTFGLEYRVPLAVIVSATVRSCAENPFELIKVRQMTGHAWTFNIRELYQGYSVLWLRSFGLLSAFFVMIDYATRFIPEVISAPLIGPFIKGGIGATIAWTLIWPFEVVKNQLQSSKHTIEGPRTTMKRMAWIIREQGIKGLYRGFTPGAMRSLIANGLSMIIFDKCQNFKKSPPL